MSQTMAEVLTGQSYECAGTVAAWVFRIGASPLARVGGAAVRIVIVHLRPSGLAIEPVAGWSRDD